MSATIGLFYERVSRAIRRGTKYDDDIPGYAADAVRELEDLENWKHMWVEDETKTLTIGTAQLDLGTGIKVKSVRFLKLIDENGAYIPLAKVQKEQVISTNLSDNQRPTAFWMINRDLIGLDEKPNIAYKYSVGYFQYSTSPLVDTLSWLTFAEDLLIARTIMKMQPLLRDDKLIQRWGQIEANRMPTLLESELVSEYDGQVNTVVPFANEIEEDRLIEVEFT